MTSPHTRALSTRGPAAVASHPAAAEAAVRAMAEGGNSIDAVIAAGAVLSVVLPQATSLGGDGYILHYQASDRGLHALNATGPAPVHATPEMFPDGPHERGATAVSVPGLIGGWSAAHERFGRLTWQALFRDAGAAAAKCEVAPSLARALETYRPMLERDPACRSIFYCDDGTPAKALRQPELARTIDRLAQEGAHSFYRDWGGLALGEFVTAGGGYLQAGDLARYAPEWVEPLMAGYRGMRVALMPPNSFGLLMALQLKLLEAEDPTPWPHSDTRRLEALMDAMRASFEVGRPHIYDGSPANLEDPALIAAVRAAHASRRKGEPVANLGGTATVSAVDAEGNLSVHILSVYMLFGAGIMDPKTGILLQNRMAGFDRDARSPAAIRPGRRPPHTLNPVMVFDGDGPRYGLATPGGPGQTLTMVQVLSNLVDLRMPLQDAVSARRWSIDFDGTAILERMKNEDDEVHETARQISQGGRPVIVAAPNTPFVGSVEAIELRSDGEHVIVADARRDAGVAAAAGDDGT